MAIEVKRLSSSLQGLLPLERFGIREVEEIRLVLRGGSVIDWKRLEFRDRDEVDLFLRLCCFEPDRPEDQERLREILAESVAFLRANFRYKVASPVAEPAEIHDLFLMASGVGENARFRRMACIVLKLMHTIFHMDARDMLFRTPISERDFFSLVDNKVRACAEELMRSGAPVHEFSGSVKSRNSVITKLLAKKDTVAAQIFDKVRYRIVTDRYEDILPVLHYLMRNLFPVSLTVPAQTQNTLFSFRRLVESTPQLRRHIPNLQLDPHHEERELAEHRRRHGVVNEFSGATYRVLNFVADVPVRLDDHLSLFQRPRQDGPNIAFAPVEFQMMDRETALQNEQGDNAHDRYKRRQQLKVLRRLSRGLVVPKKARTPKGG